MSREKKFAKNLFILSIGTFLPKFTYFITLPIMTGCLTKDEYGTYDLIVTCVSFLLPIVTLQLQAAAFRFLISCREDREQTKKVISNVLGFTIICSIIVNVILMFVFSYCNVRYGFLICVYFFIEIMLRTVQQILRGLSRNGLYTIGTITEALLNLLLVIYTVLFGGKGLFGVLISVTIADAIEILILVICAKIYKSFSWKLMNRKDLKILLDYSWPMVPNNLCLWIMNFSDRYVVTYFMGTSANAVYAAATKIPLILTIVQNIFMYAWQENASLAVNDEDANEYYEKMFEQIFRVLCGVMSVIIATTPILFYILIKGEYQESYNYIGILIMSELFHGISIFAAGIYVAKKKTKEIAQTAFFSMLVNLVIDLAFIRIIGIYAAALSTLISYVFIALFRLRGASKYSGMNIRKLEVIIFLSIETMFCILNYVNCKWGNWVNAVLCIIFAVFINRELIKTTILTTARIIMKK